VNSQCKYSSKNAFLSHQAARLFFPLAVLGFEPRALMLARQVLYHLNHNSSPFCLCYFSNGILCLCPGWPGWQSSYLHFLHCWDDRCDPPCPSFIGWDGLLWTFCLSWPWTMILPIRLPHSWDYRRGHCARLTKML
jgi:hypothetical protein